MLRLQGWLIIMNRGKERMLSIFELSTVINISKVTRPYDEMNVWDTTTKNPAIVKFS